MKDATLVMAGAASVSLAVLRFRRTKKNRPPATRANPTMAATAIPPLAPALSPLELPRAEDSSSSSAVASALGAAAVGEAPAGVNSDSVTLKQGI